MVLPRCSLSPPSAGAEGLFEASGSEVSSSFSPSSTLFTFVRRKSEVWEAAVRSRRVWCYATSRTAPSLRAGRSSLHLFFFSEAVKGATNPPVMVAFRVRKYSGSCAATC